MTDNKHGPPWPAGYGRVVLEEVGSTLDAARDIATRTPLPFWLLAHRQSAARGRRGRAWHMPDGNFAATLALPVEGAPASAALRSFVTSVALIEALDAVTGQPDMFALKWPNDVLLNGGKIAGILLENGADNTLFIGVGVNLVGRPDLDTLEAGAVRPVSLLEETGVHLTPLDFLLRLAASYAGLEQRFRDFGFGAIRGAWLSRAARLGDTITARTLREEVTGVFEDVDAEGQLVIRGPRGVRRLAAADIYF